MNVPFPSSPFLTEEFRSVSRVHVLVGHLEQEIDADDRIKAQLLENRRFSKMALDLQRVLQVRLSTMEIIRLSLPGG